MRCRLTGCLPRRSVHVGGGHEGRVMLGRLEATATQQNVSESAQRFQCLTLGDSGHNSNGLSGCPFPTCLLLGSCENSLE